MILLVVKYRFDQRRTRRVSVCLNCSYSMLSQDPITFSNSVCWLKVKTRRNRFWIALRDDTLTVKMEVVGRTEPHSAVQLDCVCPSPQQTAAMMHWWFVWFWTVLVFRCTSVQKRVNCISRFSNFSVNAVFRLLLGDLRGLYTFWYKSFDLWPPSYCIYPLSPVLWAFILHVNPAHTTATSNQ